MYKVEWCEVKKKSKMSSLEAYVVIAGAGGVYEAARDVHVTIPKY